jgi:predicted nucleotidyltransferase component of viral defense system
MNQAYVETVRLLLDIAPSLFETPAFAMKGGTALNLFVQDLPRLSVDIDVVFVPHDLEQRWALAHDRGQVRLAQMCPRARTS